jgi:dTMP kinase
MLMQRAPRNGRPAVAKVANLQPMSRGTLITIEGLDGAGKTTLALALMGELERLGVPVRLLREPGGVEAAERIRTLVKDPELRIGARTEALLFAAARAQMVEQELEPVLARGSWVLLDRFVDSSLAYQGIGRDLGVDAVKAINTFATGGLRPDRTLLLKLDPSLGRARTTTRAEEPDRLEQEHHDFFHRIAEGYAELAASEPGRIKVIDAAQPPAAVLADALAALGDLLPDAGQPE